MRIQLTKQECLWLADLARKAKEQTEAENQLTPHPLLLLRRDNMASLESKLNEAVRKEIRKSKGAR